MHGDEPATPESPSAFRSLSVVIPAWNAEPHLAATLEEVLGRLDRPGLSREVIVVDDGSSDRTADIARAFEPRGVRLIRSDRNRGKGHAVRTGMLAATGDWRLFMDVDNSTSIDHLDRCAPLTGEADVIIGSRRVAGSRIVRPQHRLRQLLGRTFPYLVRAIVLPDLADTQCGFKLFSRTAAEAIFPRQRVERFAFDVEILLLARQLGFVIREVAVEWDNPTTSTLRISTDTFQMLFEVLRIAWRLRLRGNIPDPSDADTMNPT